MSQKTRSLLLFLGLVILLGVIVLVWRALPTSTGHTRVLRPVGSTMEQSSTITTTTESSPITASTSSEMVVVPPIVFESATTTADLTMLVVGDIMLDRTVATRTTRSGDRSYPFRKLPTNWLSGFDVTIGNLEGPLTPTRRPPEKSIDFQFDPVWSSILKEQGFDAFSQANNHALDQGALGYADSVRRLREAGFTVFGHQVDDGLIALATTTVKGERLAFLGWNTTDNPINFTQAEEAIYRAKLQSDLVIAFLHWGQEYRDRPESDTVALAHWLIDHGVDVVIGGHPHWVQGISSYKGKPIVWSLGNFVFDQDWSKETQQGLTVALRVTDMEIGIQPFPVSIKLSQPALEEGEVLSARLNALARISDPEFREPIQTGKELVFTR